MHFKLLAVAAIVGSTYAAATPAQAKRSNPDVANQINSQKNYIQDIASAINNEVSSVRDQYSGDAHDTIVKAQFLANAYISGAADQLNQIIYLFNA